MKLIFQKKDDYEAFLTYTKYLNVILSKDLESKDPLEPKEVRIIALILAIYYRNKEHFPKGEVITDTSVRKMMVKKLNIPEASFNNGITSLRKKEILKGSELSPLILSVIPKKYPFNINIDIHA